MEKENAWTEFARQLIQMLELFARILEIALWDSSVAWDKEDAFYNTLLVNYVNQMYSALIVLFASSTQHQDLQHVPPHSVFQMEQESQGIVLLKINSLVLQEITHSLKTPIIAWIELNQLPQLIQHFLWDNSVSTLPSLTH